MHFSRGTTGTQRGLTEIAGFVFLETALAPSSDIAMHTHEHATIVLLLSGDYQETYRGCTENHPPLTIIAKPSGERHANRIGERGSRCLVIELTRDKVGEIDAVAPIWGNPLVETRGAACAPALRILREIRNPDALSPLALEGAALQLLVELSRASPAIYRREPKWMKDAVELLHASPPGALGLSDVAAAVGVHPVHLARTFKQIQGCSVGTYARRLQIDRALAMLTRSSAALSEVAAAAGFYDQSHMARVMKSETGMSAGQIRAAAA